MTRRSLSPSVRHQHQKVRESSTRQARPRNVGVQGGAKPPRRAGRSPKQTAQGLHQAVTPKARPNKEQGRRSSGGGRKTVDIASGKLRPPTVPLANWEDTETESIGRIGQQTINTSKTLISAALKQRERDTTKPWTTAALNRNKTCKGRSGPYDQTTKNETQMCLPGHAT